MEKEQFFKELNDKIEELSLPGTISFSPNSYKAGFSEGAKWAYELLSKETLETEKQLDELSKRLDKSIADLEKTITAFNGALEKANTASKPFGVISNKDNQ